MKKKYYRIGVFAVAIGLVFTSVIPNSFAATKHREDEVQIQESEKKEIIKDEEKIADDKVLSSQDNEIVKTENYYANGNVLKTDNEQKSEDKTVAVSVEKTLEAGKSTAAKIRAKKSDVKAQGLDLNDWSYREENGEIVLTKYTGTGADITIPGVHEGKQIVLEGGVFDQCTSIESVVIGSEQSKVKGAQSLANLFKNCKNLINIDLRGFDTSKVTNMQNMFYYCEELTDLDVSGFDTSNVTDMSYMFYNCKKLTELGVSGFDTSNVTDMNHMFYGCRELTYLDLSNFDTSKVTNMSWLISTCRKLEYVDISSFDTSNVTNMKFMFEACWELKDLDVSNFDTSNVTEMGYMFASCPNLADIDISGFDISKTTYVDGMFWRCSQLQFINMGDWSKINIGDAELRAMFIESNGAKTVIINNNKDFMVKALNGSDRQPYTAKIIVYGAEFKDPTGVNKNGDIETKTIGTGEIVYSSIDEYEKTFKYTQKEIIDMLQVQVPKGAVVEWINADTSAVFEPSDEIVDFTLGNLESLKLKPTFKYFDVTVKYNTDGGTQIADKTVKSNSTGLLPAQNPTKDGSTFIRWEVDGNSIDDNTICADLIDMNNPGQAQSVTIKAIWKEHKYTVKYETGFDDAAIPDKENVKWDEAELTPKDAPAKDGYLFKGWEINGRDVTETSKYSDFATDDTDGTSITLTARWEKESLKPPTTNQDDEDKSNTPNNKPNGNIENQSNVNPNVNKSDKNTLVKTGDNGYTIYGRIALLVSGVLMVIILISKRRKK